MPSSTSNADQEAVLRALAVQFPNSDAAMAEIARLSAVMTLPKGTVHVISDVHGEDKKLRHVINNASGTLRPLVERLFGSRLDAQQFQDLLKLVFYPAEVVERTERANLPPEQLRRFAIDALTHQFEIVRVLSARYSLKWAMQVFPAEYRELAAEMLHERTAERRGNFVEAMVDELQRRGRALHLVHLIGRLVRNLAIYELIIGGDCWDRGPRGDLVMDYLRQQPNVSFIYGNHDASWMGAALGSDALICNVLRVSLRYRRLVQVEQGYGIPLTPLEHLAREAYADDPVEFFQPTSTGLRSMETVARMHKAAAIMQFKLEGQLIARNPQWGLDSRRLMHRIDYTAGSIDIDGKRYELRDRLFPTVNPADPYTLTAAEQACVERLRESFLQSQKLQEHIAYFASNGSMWLTRDENLIFHGCVPCDESGNFLSLSIDGQDYAGRALFDQIDRIIPRALERRQQSDIDLLWYLWAGPRAPTFGKDRITTFERDFISDKAPHRESKNPYFQLIHDARFCEKVLREFGVDPERGLIVNGHVPVKIEEGEDPLKRSGKAITIDGAFSEAYGDHGYTLLLEADRTVLAQHYHFESVEAAIKQGVDIIPSISVIRQFDRPRRIADTERGREMAAYVRLLEKLMEAYRTNQIRQSPATTR